MRIGAVGRIVYACRRTAHDPAWKHALAGGMTWDEKDTGNPEQTWKKLTT